jgi:signal transduction histidine kinase
MPRILNPLVRSLREQELFSSLLVFVLIFLTARLGHYIFYTSATSPAVIWAPTGIALAAVILGGYRMWLPIALGFMLFSLSVHHSWLMFLAVSIGYTLQTLLGGYILKRFRFDATLSRTRDALLIIGVSLVIPTVAPAIITGALWLSSSLAVSPWLQWSRSWAGSVLSVMVLTPFIISWLRRREFPIYRREVIEAIFAQLTLVGATYIIFWTKLPQANIFLSLYAFFAVLFWAGLRLGPRIMSLSIFAVTAIGMAGSAIAGVSTVPLNQQLFADELFMVLITPIFLILSALVEERRVTARELKHSIGELQDALHKLGVEDQSKNEFIATLAHELRNPLAPVVSTLEYLKLEEQTPETRRMILSAEEQTQIMRRLLDDLLDVARVTQKRFRLQEEPMSLQEAVTRSIRTVEDFILAQGHRMNILLPEEPLLVYGDSVRLTQIFTNVLYNAAKYTPQGGEISLEAHAEGGKAVVSITDNGIGIENERLERIFEPFVHTGPRKTVGTGLGIGLSLTKRLIEMHNGSIEAISEGPGKGSMFIVTLPLLPVQQIVSAPEPVVTRTSTGPLKILIVDDNEAAAQGLEKLLTYKGHTVLLAYDGESALPAAQESRPDVVLLDIGLPGIDGYEVAEILRSLNPTPYIVALTGYGQDDDKNKALTAGFNYHLTKPVGILDIESVLSTITSSPI